MTADAILKRIVASGCQCSRGEYVTCAVCFGPVAKHAADCAYVEARKYLQQQEAVKQFLEEMGERFETWKPMTLE